MYSQTKKSSKIDYTNGEFIPSLVSNSNLSFLYCRIVSLKRI